MKETITITIKEKDLIALSQFLYDHAEAAIESELEACADNSDDFRKARAAMDRVRAAIAVIEQASSW